MKATSFIKAIDNQFEVAVGHFLASIGSYSLNERSKGSEMAQLGRQESLRLTALRTFYTQEFLPQMIMQYFEGWEEGNIYPYGNFQDTGTSYGFAMKEHLATYFVGTGELNMILPETLDDFVRDCERCNIPLVWEKQIVEKYFK